jgi:hypothetical protein
MIWHPSLSLPWWLTTALEEDQALDATSHSIPASSPKRRHPRCRREVAASLAQFQQLDAPGISCCEIARRIHVPRRTLAHQAQRQRQRSRRSSWPKEVVRFFESPQGLEVLHRLWVAIHLVFVQANDTGIRSVSWFLRCSGLAEFIAPSYGAQRAFAEQMESLLIRFAEEEDRRLAESMPPREITVCEDETFHPTICLVAIEPVSNFLLLEQYQPCRDMVTWNQCLDQRLAGMPITVIQVASDEAKALIAHAKTHLGAHHSPDLFHVQQDLSRATSAALAGQTKAAGEELTKAQETTAALRAQQEACRQQCSESTFPQEIAPQICQAEADEQTARARVAACQERQQRVTDARRGVSRDYHPFDLGTGRPQTAEEVAAKLAGHFAELDRVADEAGLSPHARRKLTKARGVLDAMKATLVFFWLVIARRLDQWALAEPHRVWMREQLIPGYYLQQAAAKAPTAQERRRLRELSQEILARARSPDGLWGSLSREVQADLEAKAQACAALFQRSSSCVEGRNGQLSLKHHALHQLSGRKLKVLTVLGNYVVRRRDGTTAAERFYGCRPRDVFAWLLGRLSLPAYPRLVRRAA